MSEQTPVTTTAIIWTTGASRRLAELLGNVLRDHLPLLWVIGAFVSFSVLDGPLFGWRGFVGAGVYLTSFCVVSACYLVIAVCVHRLQFKKLSGPEGWWATWRRSRHYEFSAARVAGAALVAMAFTLLLPCFTGWKLIIPQIHPFALDRAFMYADLIVHGGIAPWALLQPILGHPAITAALDFVYAQVWYATVMVVVVWQAWAQPSLLRSRFLVTYAAVCVVLGVVVATLLSSAGPAYYSVVTGESSPYGPLMSYLLRVDAESTIVEVHIQRQLLSLYVDGAREPFAGISAMPSMHVAMSTLCAIVGWKTNRILGTLLTAFAVTILLGSIHLGVHYAVDGYVAALGTCALWVYVGRVLRAYSSPDSRLE